MTIRCPKCKSPVDDLDDIFCRTCGLKLHLDEDVETKEQRAAQLELDRLTSPEHVEEVIAMITDLKERLLHAPRSGPARPPLIGETFAGGNGALNPWER